MDLGEPIAKGNTADIYLRDNKVIKLFSEATPDVESEYEAYKQRYVYSKGLPTPCIYEVTKINGKQAIIMEYVAGRTIGDIVINDMTKAEEYMNISVDIQLQIHNVKANDFELMVDKLKRQVSKANLLSDKQKDSLTDKLQSMQCEKTLCHGDYHVFNLIYDNGKTTIIDWVDSSAGDNKADVYRTYLLYSQFNTDLAKLYLRLYCEKSGISKDEIFLWEPIIAGARLSENTSAEKAEGLLKIVNRYCSN